MALPPFPKHDELYTKLSLAVNIKNIIVATSVKKHLPGNPRLHISSQLLLPHYLESQLTTLDLDKLLPYIGGALKLGSGYITPLTKQVDLGRNIILTKNPELHLVWEKDVVYINSLPKYLLSYDFWKFFMARPELASARAGALGFLRTWALLVRNEMDFYMAMKKDLLPRNIEYDDFVEFIKHFEDLQDERISLRYSRGELQLDQLNLWAPIALRRWNFYKTTRQTRIASIITRVPSYFCLQSSSKC